MRHASRLACSRSCTCNTSDVGPRGYMLVLTRSRHGDAGARARGPERRRLQVLGVASSGSTMFRQIAGSIGVAVFGAIFANRLATNLAGSLPPGAGCEDGESGRAPATCRRPSTAPSSPRSPTRCTRVPRRGRNRLPSLPALLAHPRGAAVGRTAQAHRRSAAPSSARGDDSLQRGRAATLGGARRSSGRAGTSYSGTSGDEPESRKGEGKPSGRGEGTRGQRVGDRGDEGAVDRPAASGGARPDSPSSAPGRRAADCPARLSRAGSAKMAPRRRRDRAADLPEHRRAGAGDAEYL